MYDSTDVLGTWLLVFLLGGALSSAAMAQCYHPAGGDSFDGIGDLNQNGTINVADTVCGVLMTLWAVGDPANPLPTCMSGTWIRSDVTCDGSVDVSDVVANVRYVLSGEWGTALDPMGTGCPQACEPCSPPMGGSCLISGCIPEGQEQAGSPCMACDPDADPWGYSERPDGTACEGASGKECLAGACVVVAPGAPSIAAVTPDVESATIAFSAPTSNGGELVTSYRLVCSPTAGGSDVEVTGAASPLVATGLAGGAEYTCVVYASNSVGEGPASAASAAFTALSSGPSGFSGGDCTDWMALGWTSREECLRDGNWHPLGTYSPGVAVPSADMTLIDSLVRAGAEFKLQVPVAQHAIFDVERIITDCSGAGRVCFYVRRERALGLSPMGIYIAPDAINGQFGLARNEISTVRRPSSPARTATWLRGPPPFAYLSAPRVGGRWAATLPASGCPRRISMRFASWPGAARDSRWRRAAIRAAI